MAATGLTGEPPCWKAGSMVVWTLDRQEDEGINVHATIKGSLRAMGTCEQGAAIAD